MRARAETALITAGAVAAAFALFALFLLANGLKLKGYDFHFRFGDGMHAIAQGALDLPESQVATVTQGMAAKVVATSDASLEMVGRLRFDRFPSSRSAGAPENTYDATVELDSVAPTLFAGMRCKVLLEVGKK